MKKAVREHLEARGYISTAAASQEGRVRQLVADLTGILNRRDTQALKQSAALARVPSKRPKPAPVPTSFVREVALGKIVVPDGNYDERQRVIEHRMHMRERLNSGAFSNPFNEFSYENQAFKREEESRVHAATVALKRGIAPGHVCANFYLTVDEVQQMLDQLAGRPPAAPDED